MGYYVSGCRWCHGRADDHECTCDCHNATQEEIEMGKGHCTPEMYD